MVRGRVGGLLAPCLAVTGALVALAAAAVPPHGPTEVVPVAGSAMGASSGSARVAIDSCLKRLNPEIDIGYERISARCPDLARRIEASGGWVWLPRDWKRPGNDLSAGGLRQLQELLSAGERLPSAGARRLDVAALPAVLASLGQDGGAEGHGWWTRTKAWLRDVFERGEEEDDDWFSHFVAQNGFSQVVIELVSYVALALVVVLAVIIVANELRVSGWLGRLWRRFVKRRHSGEPDADVIGAPEGSAIACRTLADVENAERALQPRLLLELITGRLTDAGLLPPSRGLTVSELTRAALLSEEVDRERLTELARMSERMRFSDEPVSNAAVTSALQDGRMLLERLSQPASARVRVAHE